MERLCWSFGANGCEIRSSFFSLLLSLCLARSRPHFLLPSSFAATTVHRLPRRNSRPLSSYQRCIHQCVGGGLIRTNARIDDFFGLSQLSLALLLLISVVLCLRIVDFFLGGAPSLYLLPFLCIYQSLSKDSHSLNGRLFLPLFFFRLRKRKDARQRALL